MSREDAIVLASRTLALFLTVWVLSDLCYVPERVYSFLRYSLQGSALSPGSDYWYHSYAISLGILIVRIVGLSLTARWLFKGGPSVTKLFLPSDQDAAQN